ncbi:hypothetical protein [Xenorhabdus hominickii]|uniref:Uncharacterized protein n=1 Tax=Xenorhabdus hominickii TaxID=351679 RepID=A0A1D7P3E3_XENHO|nr:hypothetical protein [Xenorhabdus hominickii]AOM39657.1 hypothetical protein A9255_03055 [Xenorhabdus hominickii]AOM40193.1 hypothetical protein A9255_06125 [Xenorhabdus hominickii]PHM53305.1 hypothetical protein Xhom_04200 [Xenorhabdus hominickii]PHM54553.1 hypothetical protein Xhom_02496 [Xenorhabdus hominickii]
MSAPITESLVIRPASEQPTPDMNGKEVLVLNPCDGWHIGYVNFWDGEYSGIYRWIGEEFEPRYFYVAWALLPDGLKIGDAFEDQSATPEEHDRYWAARKMLNGK